MKREAMASRVSIVTNSQGTRTGVSLGESYPALARRELTALGFDVQLLVMSGWSIVDVNAQLENVLLFEPDLVLVQIGIVECTRRILSRREKNLLSVVPGGWRVTRWLHDRRAPVVRVRRRLGIDAREVKLPLFEAEVERLVAAIGETGAELVLLEIPSLPAGHDADYLPHGNEDIEAYNRVLRKHRAQELLRRSDPLDELFQEQSVHLSPAGHLLAAERLVAIVSDRLEIIA